MEQSPSAEDFAKEAKATVRYEADGSWVATVRGEENMRRAAAMQEGVRRADMEMGELVNAKRDKERIVDSEGRAFDAPVHLAEQIAKKRGMRAKPKWGRPSMRWAARDGSLVRVF